MEEQAGSILVVDDDSILRETIVAQLETLDDERVVLQASDGVEALEVLDRGGVDLVVTDLRMPRLDGLELMRTAKERGYGPAWIILSGLGTFSAAVEAIQLGAFDFIDKSADFERIRVSVGNALATLELRRERDLLLVDLERRNALLALELEEMAGLCKKLEDQAETIRLDLERAETIQRALLPSELPALAGFRVETLYRPGRHVGGDLYDIALLDSRHLMILVADASGHGVSSAMVSVLLKHHLHPLQRSKNGGPRQPVPPAQVLAELNRELYDAISPEGMFVTAAYGILDMQERTLTLASAGHPPVLIASSGRVDHLRSSGPALGLDVEARYAETKRSIEPGTRILLYTDGVQGLATAGECRDLLDAQLGSECDAREALEVLFEAATATPDEDPDDMTLVLLEAVDGESHLDHEHDRHGEPCTAPSFEPRASLEVANDAVTGFVRLTGRCTWISAPTLHAWVGRCVEEGRRVVIDLSQCEHVDSTVLGTLHDAVRRGKDAGVVVVLQGVSPEHRAQFEELAMEAVLAAVRDEAVEPPGTLCTPPTASSVTESQEHILRAHEALADLSDGNRAAFGAVIESLRRELEARRSTPNPVR